MAELPLSLDPDGVGFAVRLTPRARRSEIAGLVADADGRTALSIRVAAPPVEGAANKALVSFLAERLARPRSSIRILSGETSRVKIVHLAGDGEEIAVRLRALIESQ